MKSDKSIKERLSSLEALMKDTREEIKYIKEHHLTSIYNKLEKIERELLQRPSWLIALLLSGLLSLITGLIVFILSK